MRKSDQKRKNGPISYVFKNGPEFSRNFDNGPNFIKHFSEWP